MYNYDNEYEQGYETDYEFNPESESDYEMEAQENESDNEYEMDPEFEMEESFETQNDYEMDDEQWQNEIRVRDHRTNRNPGTRYRPSPRTTVRTGRPVQYRGANSSNRRWLTGTAFRRSPNRSFFRPGYRRPYYRRRPGNYWGMRPWYRRYAPSYGVYGYNYAGQPQQYPQGSDMYTPSPAQAQAGAPDHIMQSIQALAQQLASTNANVEALQQSVSSNANQGMMNTPPPGGANQPTGANMPESAPGGEMEMEDYEYDTEYEMMNEEGNAEMEEMEMEMAAGLLSTNNEMELDNFLGSFLGNKLKKLIKVVIKKTLPVAGAAVGGFLAGPSGAVAGNKMATEATKVFELDLEGLSKEDQEFEVAKAVVRLATDAAREMEEGESSGDPQQDAKNALIQSAMQNARGLLVKKGGYNNGGSNY